MKQRKKKEWHGAKKGDTEMRRRETEEQWGGRHDFCRIQALRRRAEHLIHTPYRYQPASQLASLPYSNLYIIHIIVLISTFCDLAKNGDWDHVPVLQSSLRRTCRIIELVTKLERGVSCTYSEAAVTHREAPCPSLLVAKSQSMQHLTAPQA